MTIDLDTLLDEEREIQPVSREARQRLSSRLSESIGALSMEGVSNAEGSHAPSSRQAAAPLGKGVPGWALIGTFLLGGVLGGGLEHLRSAQEISRLKLEGSSPTSAPSSSVPPAEGTAQSGSERHASAEAIPIGALPAERLEPVKAASSSRPDDESLRQERVLLEQAQMALVRSEFTSVRKALEEHRSRFPRGKLSEERDSLLVVALARSGDPTAYEAAKRFNAAYPNSVLRGVVNAAVERAGAK